MKIEAGSNSLEIIIKRSTHPDSNDYWDGNWLDAWVILCIDRLKSSYSMFLRSDEFDRFLNRRKNVTIQHPIKGTHTWEFHTMEDCLEFSITVKEDHAKIKGFVCSEPDHDEVEFEFDTDYNAAIKFILEANDILNE